MSDTPKNPAVATNAAAGKFARVKAMAQRALPKPQAAMAWIGGKWVVAAVVGVGIIVLGGVTFWWLLRDVEQFIEDSPSRVIATAYESLERGVDEEAQQTVERLQPWSRLKPDQLAAVQYLMGVVTARVANDALGAEKRRQSALAARYFEDAHDHGFPPGYEAEGLWQWTLALFGAEQMPECRELALEALEELPDRAAELHRMLAATYLVEDPPEFALALRHNAAYLADESIDAEAKQRARLQHADICFKQRDFAACREALAQITPPTPLVADAKLLEARILIEEAAAQQGPADIATPAPDDVPWKATYQRAIETLREAVDADTIASQVTPKSMYLTGLCFQRMGDARAAVDQYERTAVKYFNSPEATAAGLMRGEILRQLAHHDEAIESYREALETGGSRRTYQNEWIPLAELQRLGIAAYQSFLGLEQFEAATDMARVLRPLLPELMGLRLMAEAQRQWGQALAARPSSLTAKDALEQVHDGRERLREAGRMFGELADANNGSRTFAEDLWESAQAYLAGHDFSAAAVQLRTYLNNETKGQRPAALVAMGTALLSLDRRDEALHYLAECIEFYPRDAASYRARLLAAQAHGFVGHTAEAEELLAANLQGDALNPQSREWRLSLFELGKLLYSAKRYEEAVPRLSEALVRYPDDPQALSARYYLAESHRELARKPVVDEDETARVGHEQRVQTHLRQALASYEAIEETLRNRQRGPLQAPEEVKLLRNSHFARGAVLIDLGRLVDAIDAFTSASTQYQDLPEVLLAYESIADCYRRLNQPLEAKNILQQARVVLERMSPEAPFLASTNYSRDQWKNRLDALEELLTL